MRKKRITLKDVAKEAGVSYQTVSKVLRDQIQVTAQTKERIETAVTTLGYRPNITARNLRTQSTQLIGYSWRPQETGINPILEEFLNSIVDTAETRGYHIMLFPFGGDAESWVDTYHDLIISNRVDGFILSGMDYDDPRIPLLQSMNFPFVAFGRSNPAYTFPYVDVNGRSGMRDATQHLIEQGHQRIAILAWPEGSRVGSARVNGYLEAMQTATLPINPTWIQRNPGTFEYGHKAMTTLLTLPEAQRPTGIVTLVDSLAIGAMRAIQEQGLKVGTDIGVVGFDDNPLTQYLSPSLSSVKQPITQVGQEAISLLITLLQGEEPPQTEIMLNPKLIIRESSIRYENQS